MVKERIINERNSSRDEEDLRHLSVAFRIILLAILAICGDNNSVIYFILQKKKNDNQSTHAA
jgi:hypothetical protein